MTRRATRRSASQKIGRQGELVFEHWAIDCALNPHKVTEDIGIDYYCETLARAGRGVEESTGTIVAVQVRATSGADRPRVRLDRVDVETALRLTPPYFLAAVASRTHEVFFRFLDTEILAEWVAFLTSSRKYMTLRLDEMHSDPSAFADKLREVRRPAFREKYEQSKVELNLQAVVPGAALRISRGPAGEWALVSVPQMPQILNVDSPEKREAATRLFFRPTEYLHNLHDAIRRYALLPEFSKISDLTDGPLLIAGGTESRVEMYVELQGSHETSPFTLRRAFDERAFIGACGLVIRVSDARKSEIDKARYHHLNFAIECEGAVDLPSSRQLHFLRLLQPGAVINESGRQGIPVEHFGLEKIGAATLALESVYKELGLSLGDTYLADFADKAFAANIGFLEAAFDKANARPLIPTFIIGLDEESPVAEKWQPCSYRVPLVLSLKTQGVVVWTEGEADAYIHERTIHGFRFRTRTLTEVKLSDLPFANTTVVTAWVQSDWSPLPIMDVEIGNLLVQKGDDLPFGGEFRFA